jgi:hypothetical protein
MYYEASLDRERCTNKLDEKIRRNCIATHLRQIDQYEDVNIPYKNPQEDATMEEEEGGTKQQRKTHLPPSGSGLHPLAGRHVQVPTSYAPSRKRDGGTYYHTPQIFHTRAAS